MAYFPLFTELSGRSCLVTGGGAIAAGKARQLASFGAKVTVVAEEFCDEIYRMPGARQSTDADQGTALSGAPDTAGDIVLMKRSFRDEDIEGMALVVAATNDSALNEHISALCRMKGIPVNVVDKKELCTFTFPSIVRQEDLVIAISTGGNSPAMAAFLRKKLSEYIPSVYGSINSEMGSVREYIQRNLPKPSDRKQAFSELLELLTGERTLRIGTRTSLLAAAQTRLFTERLKESFPDMEYRIIPMKTLGDRLRERSLRDMGGKGIFTEVMEDALRDGEIDCAVHSAKDMASALPDDMALACVLPRDDPADVLVVSRELAGASGRAAQIPDIFRQRPLVIGTGSPRREAQLKQLFPLCIIRDIRGNINTRLDKLRRGDYDAVVLASAGLRRAGLDREEDLCYCRMPLTQMVPAGGQGTIAVETLSGRLAFLGALSDEGSKRDLEAERLILRLTGADCHDAVGVYARSIPGQDAAAGCGRPAGGCDLAGCADSHTAETPDSLICIDIWKAGAAGSPEAIKASGSSNAAAEGTGKIMGPEARAGMPAQDLSQEGIFHISRTADPADAMRLAAEMAGELIRWESYQ